MKLPITLAVLLFVGLAAAAPSKSADDDIVVITEDFYPDSFIKYRSKHEIVSLLVPVNALNFDESDSGSDEDDDIILFFVEADIKSNGRKKYKGLYVLKNNKATKLLKNGRDAAASSDNSKQVFFGASDGIYEYKASSNRAVKYGTVTDSIISIAVTNTSDVIYILTEDNELFKVTESGTVKTKVAEVVDAQEIVLDYSNNLYFYSQDKKPYALTADGLKRIKGLPANPSKVNLLKPPFVIEDGVPFVADNVAYIIYANGTSERSDFEFQPNAKPTAYAMEATLVQYFAYNKKIYEYNLLAMVLGEMVAEFNGYLENKASAIQSLASQKKRNRNKI